ncbi:methyl-accepting chemotaxis protein [Aurantivibrio infirmus]
MAVSILHNLAIRKRIWLLVFCSITALAGIATLDLLEARTQFTKMKLEQYEKLVSAAVKNVDYYYQQSQAGTMTEIEARQAAKAALQHMAINEREYFFIHETRFNLLVSHPFINTFNDDTEAGVKLGRVIYENLSKQTTEKYGNSFNLTSAGKLWSDTYPNNNSGFIEYWLYLPQGETTSLTVPYTDEKPHSEAEHKASYGKRFEPWNWLVMTGVYMDDVNATFLSWLKFLVLNATIAILILLVLGLWISLSISKPLRAITALMIDISSGSGNLTKRLSSKGRNELTQFADGFNTFVEKITDIIQKVSRTTKSVASHSSDLSQSMERTVALADEQLAETEMLASATNELSYSLKSVAERAQNSSKAASSAQEASDQSSEVMARNIEAINALTEALLNTQSEVENMEAFSDKVSSVLEVIVGIAEQTNLLALNAAIEAARAGEQGRGFAVVADEVRTLASRTQNSTSEIHTIIENLQSGTQRVVHAMKDGLKNSEICATTATESNQVLTQVKAYVEEITQMNIDIAAAVEQQSKTTQEIAESSQKIADNSKRTLDDNEKNQQSNQSMSTQVQDVDNLVKQFKID